MRSSFRTTLVAGCIAISACSDAVAPDSAHRPSLSTTSVTEPSIGPWARIVEGVTGEGARYAIYVPRAEVANGEAVYYAHGIRDALSPIDLRDQDSFYALRDEMGTLGYAVAYSSFSENGFAVKDGAQRTHQLRGLVAATLGGQPTRSYLVGHSLGGGIALDLAERYPTQYNGALAMCGMVGGSVLQTQYLGNVRALATAYFGDKLPGSVLESTPVTMPQVIAAVQSNPMGLFAIASTKQTPLPYVPLGDPMNPASPAFQTLVGSLFAGLSFHARGIENMLELTHGQTPFDNAGTVYELGTSVLPQPYVDPALKPMITGSNVKVERVSFGEAAENYLVRNFTPSGDLRIPVITIHNRWDPVVPAFHESALAAIVDAAGRGDMLEQRYVDTYGHCAIPVARMVEAFQDVAARAR
jgi:predicted esterase